MHASPLQHLRVFEVGDGVAVRYCGRLFARLGAAVVLRAPSSGDAAIGYGGRSGEAYGQWLDEGKVVGGVAGPFDLVVAGQTPAEVSAAAALARTLPGAPTLLGVTWFGETGPYASWAGNDAILQALTGAAFSFGENAGPPTLAQGHAPQTVAGVTAFIAALAGLMNPARRPSRIDVTVFEAAMCFTEVTGAIGPEATLSRRVGVNRFVPTYPASVYETLDGAVGVTALTPAQWASLCNLIGRPDLAFETRFATALERLENGDEIDTILRPAFRQRATDAWIADGDRMRIPIAPVPTPGDLPGMPHWRDRGAFAPFGEGDVQGPTLPFRMTWQGPAAPRPAGGEAGPLEGVRVADFSMGWAGPLAGRYLADLGAEVLKIESKAKPDWWRGWEIMQAADPPPWELPRNFMCVNRGKHGLDIDLTQPEGLATAKAVIAAADVVIENLGPGVMDRLGLGPADQARLRPGVISVSMPPFGKNGPLSGIRAYGSTVEHGSGMPYANGHAHWPPCLQHVAYGDPVAGLFAAAAVLTALHGRERLGGADVELCQVECLFQLGADAGIAQQVMGAPPPRTGSRRAIASPSCVVPCLGEDAWVAVVVDRDEAWRGLCAVLGRPDWASLSRLERAGQADAIEAEIAKWTRGRAPDEAAASLQAAGVPAAPAHPMSNRWTDPHLNAADYWLMQERRYVGLHRTPQPPFRFDGARPVIRGPAPVLGEHTEQALASLGLT